MCVYVCVFSSEFSAYGNCCQQHEILYAAVVNPILELATFWGACRQLEFC